MKNLSFLFTAIGVCFLLMDTSLIAQITTPNTNNNQITTTQNNTVGLCNKADLRITDFVIRHVTKGQIFGSGLDQRRYYYLNYKATVKNLGSIGSVACNLQTEYSRYNENNFTSGGNCDNFATLNSGGMREVNGTITVFVPLSHTTVKLRLYIDAPCEDEALPIYIKVNECNESNNHSAIVTQSLL